MLYVIRNQHIVYFLVGLCTNCTYYLVHTIKIYKQYINIGSHTCTIIFGESYKVYSS